MDAIESLKDDFEREMREICSKETDIGIYSTRFRAMIEERGGLEAAHLLLDPKRQLPPMFEHLRSIGRADLTMEHIVLKPKYNPLFSEQERAIARFRLTFGD